LCIHLLTFAPYSFLSLSPFVLSFTVFPYQCSPLSNSAGIEQAFASAQRYRRESPGTVVVVLLDEVGLAEQSPHLPLKVLHKLLDEAGDNESVVGISNWTLDPAKMNRAVHLFRPAPTVEDLALTAEGMVKSANLKGYLGALAKAYSAVYHAQSHADFWGLREYYSTVRAINAAINQPSTTFHEGEGGGTGQAMASSLSAKHPDGNLASALDASRSASDIVVLKDSFEDLPMLLRISRMACHLSQQNFAIAAIYNGVSIPLAIAGYATPLAAALAMSISSITVLLNSQRIRFSK
jgi:hypothetical protein